MPRITPAKGRRPRSIQLFVVSFLGAAIYAFLLGLGDLELQQTAYAAAFAWDGWSRDWTIVTLSALLSVALIPVGLIYIFANRIARWLVTVFTLIELANLPGMIATFQTADEPVRWSYFAQPLLLALSLLFLFLPESNRWFSQGKGSSPETFN